MKLLDNLIKRIGQDKFDHHILGTDICSLITIISIIQDGIFDWTAILYTFIGTAVVFFLSVIKEYTLDDKIDWKDIAWAMLGCLWVFISVTIGIVFNQFSI